MKSIKKISKQVEETAKKKIKKKDKLKVNSEDILSSGSTLLNLACTNNPFGAFVKGKYYYLVGDTASGKTFLSMSCLVESLINPVFKDYRLIYDDVEGGMNISIEKLFNKELAEKIEFKHSGLIEEFYYNLDDAIKEEKPFIYILDSMDGLDSKEEKEKFEEEKKAYEKDKIVAGSYGTSKAKKNSTNMRRVTNKLNKTPSILIVISQTRDNLGFGFEKKTRSGGHSLSFYAHTEIWSNIVGKIKKTVKGKKRTIGVHIGLKVKKNRTTGELHEVYMDIYPSYGIDDIGSMVDYLVEEDWWTKSGKTIKTTLGVSYSKDKLIKWIEDNCKAKEIQREVGRCWNSIREACSIKRRKRY